MPSSTSSSDPRPIPGGDWRATWFVALALVVAALAGFEHVVRAHGHRPSVTDDPVRWSLFRRTVDGDPRVVAFVGTSRMEMAYDGAAFAAAAPGRRAVQLAINGIVARPILEDLADDPDFRGLAVVDVDEWDLGWGDPMHGAQAYVDRAHALWRAPGAVANRVLATWVQARLAMLAIGGRSLLLQTVNQRRLPPPRWVVADADRVSHGDYSLADRAALEKARDWRLANFDTPPMPAADWLALADQLEPLVAKIRARGGDVVFVRLPVSGKLAAGFARDYPRAQYWDAFAARSSAKVIHYLDVPALAHVVCPDEMHVDQKDQPAVTRALVDALRAKNAL